MKPGSLGKDLNKCLSAFTNGVARGDFYPVYYGIETSRLCNFACIMCPHPKYAASEKGNMSWDLYTSIIDQIAPHAEIIKLHWVGEPLINPQIIEMIRYARAATDAKLHLSTNASLLHGQLADDLRTSGIDKVIFSLDGNSPETFERIRVNGDYHQVVNNIKAFVESVEAEGGPISEVKLIQFNENASEIEAFREKWDRYKSVIVYIMWLSTWAGQLTDMSERSEYQSPYSASSRHPCADLWFKMQVNWLGDVNLCCFDWSGEVTLGNLSEQSLLDIWQGEKIVNERERHMAGKYEWLCAPCKEWAKVQEYEFWYDYEQLKEDASIVWSSKSVPGFSESGSQEDG